MSLEVLRHRAAEEAITEACAYLSVDRPAFFELALRWAEVGPTLWSQTSPGTFYTSWRGDLGQAAVAANVMDQFSRQDVWAMTHQLLTRRQDWVYLDYGCGTASISFPFLNHCRTAVLLDVPNDSQEFVRWRVAQHGLQHTVVCTPEQSDQLPPQAFSVIACIDVLEHLPQPTAVFEQLDALLQPGGLLLFRAPWAREGEDFGEHLPEATAEWHRPGGGAEQLTARYTAIAPLNFGAVYQKAAG